MIQEVSWHNFSLLQSYQIISPKLKILLSNILTNQRSMKEAS